MRNQFGQDISVGDWVGHVSRAGSTMTFKVGKVTGFGQRKEFYRNTPIFTVYADWKGAFGSPRGVGIDRVFKLDPEGLEP